MDTIVPPDRPIRRGDTVDRYVIEEKLGEGGAAVVYRVRHQELGTVHALKLLRVVVGGMRDRLVQEGRIQATLRHPNIVAVTDVVRIAGFPGLVMEYVPGPTLDQLLVAYRPTLAQIDDLARGLLAGVRAAHEKGLVHRDLKPGNVLLHVGTDKVVPKVTDFGLAKVLDDDATDPGKRTRTGTFMGTPTFMAPEQFRSAKGVDHRADVFALGALLYELVSGCAAFHGEDVITVYTSTSTGHYTPLHQLAPQAPERWIAAVHQALQPDVDLRIQTVADLLDRWVGGEPPPAAPWDAESLARLVKLGETVERGPDSSVTFSEAVVPPEASAAVSRTVATTSVSPRVATVAATVAIALVAIAVVSLLAVGLSALAFRAWTQPSPTTAPVEVAAPAPLPPPPEPIVAPPEPPPTVEAPAPPSSTPRPAAPPAAPRVAAPTPAPAPDPRPVAAPDGTRVEVVGGGRVWLEDPLGRRFPPGAVEPGSYTVYAFFDAAKPTKVMDLVVVAGEQRIVKCDAVLRVCR